ncbi:hypothetical protein K7X08_003478 [Anisodus acutangulus]|uniref:Uncharacterized protein n=1 Tax=Anisodus acutangulus TaxID=402998 RepID=A0A9Q1MFU3_9SOLA|nr:hypothetical protein K7X08_003478 [Anisodus acutangulus]
MLGMQTETEEAKGSDSVKDNTEDPKTSNKQVDFNEKMSDFAVGGQDGVGDQVGDDEACNKQKIDLEELKRHPDDAPISVTQCYRAIRL